MGAYLFLVIFTIDLSLRFVDNNCVNDRFSEIILSLPAGAAEVVYEGRKYLLTKEVYNGGKSLKIFARELGGNDFISLNYYITTDKEILRPCEMREEKVVDFILGMKII